MRISKPIERWFNFTKDPDKSKVKILHLSSGQVQDIFDSVYVQRIEYKQGDDGAVMAQTVDKKKDREMTICLAVTDWENHFDENGDPMPCTDENKIRAMREIEGWLEAVNGFRKKLADDITKEKTAQKKT